MAFSTRAKIHSTLLPSGVKSGLAFNEAKTEVLFFTNKKKFQIPWKLDMNGKSLEPPGKLLELAYRGIIILSLPYGASALSN